MKFSMELHNEAHTVVLDIEADYHPATAATRDEPAEGSYLTDGRCVFVGLAALKLETGVKVFDMMEFLFPDAVVEAAEEAIG